MSKLFRNSNPEALTRRQAAALEKKRNTERRAAYRKAAELAAQGRGGDTEVAHVTPGEIVLPEALQTPAVLNALRRAAMSANMSLEQFRVGSPRNSINPQTGQPEFFDMSSMMPWGAKRRLNYCDHGMMTEDCESWLQGFMKDKPEMYMPTADDLARMPDAQKDWYAQFYEGAGNAEDVMGSAAPGVGGLFGRVGKWVGRQVGREFDQDSATRAEIAKAYRDAIQNPKR